MTNSSTDRHICGTPWSVSVGPGRIVGPVARSPEGVFAPLPDDFEYRYCASCRQREMTADDERRFLSAEAAHKARSTQKMNGDLNLAELGALMLAGGVFVYMASKTRHAPTWRGLRAAGVPVISTWIDEAEPGETRDFADLWSRCVREASTASALIVYAEEGDMLKGGFVEVGAALGCGVPVFAVGAQAGWTFTHHPLVTKCENVPEALRLALRTRSPG